MVRVDLALLDVFEKFLPVEVHGGLAVSDQADTAFHDGADVKVVCLRNVLVG